MNYNLIEQGKCGITLENNSAEELANAIKDLINLPLNERIKIGKNGLKIAKEFDYQNLTKRFLYVIEKTLYGKSNYEYWQYVGE